jgi:hypothetical protein
VATLAERSAGICQPPDNCSAPEDSYWAADVIERFTMNAQEFTAWASDHGVSDYTTEEILVFSATPEEMKAAYDDYPLPVYSLRDIVQMTDEDAYGISARKNGFILVGGCKNGDPIAIDVTDGSVWYICHEKMHYKSVREVSVRVAVDLTEMMEGIAANMETTGATMFPYDYFQAIDRERAVAAGERWSFGPTNIVFVVPEDGDEISSPRRGWLQESVLCGGADFWCSGSGQGRLKHPSGSELLLAFATGHGFFPQYVGPLRDQWLTYSEERGEGKVPVWIGGDPIIVSSRFFVSPELTWAAVQEFCESGGRTDLVNWKPESDVEWSFGYWDHPDVKFR